LSPNETSEFNPLNLSIKSLTDKQRLHLNSPLIDMDNTSNEIIPSFSPFNQEFFPGNRLSDIFSNQFLFQHHSPNIKYHVKNLDNIVLEASSDHFSSIVVSNASIKNGVATSISHIHSYNNPIIKTIHHTTNITTMEAKLFAIRCGINQAVNIPNVK